MAASNKSETPRFARRRATVTVPVAGTALLLIDVINDLTFDESGPLVEARTHGVSACGAQAPRARQGTHTRPGVK